MRLPLCVPTQRTDNNAPPSNNNVYDMSIYKQNTIVNTYKQNTCMNAYKGTESINSFYFPLDIKQSGSNFYYYLLITDFSLPFREGLVQKKWLGILHDAKLTTQIVVPYRLLCSSYAPYLETTEVQLAQYMLCASLMITKRGSNPFVDAFRKRSYPMG